MLFVSICQLYTFYSGEIIALFNKSLDKNEEGIVIKECDVIYKPQMRTKSGCYKTKAEVWFQQVKFITNN